MKWIDGSSINIKEYTGETLTEKIATEMYDHGGIEACLDLPEFVRTACLIIDLDTELNMEGIFTLLENTTGQYLPEIIEALRNIGDDNDAVILSEICRLAHPEQMRAEFLEKGHEEYDIASFDDDHEMDDETAEKIEELESRLYLNSDFDMWELLYSYLDNEIAAL